MNNCEEKLRLLSEYRDATDLYSDCVTLMAEIADGLVSKIEFASLSRSASQAHEKCVETREQFYRHIEEHGC